MHYLTLSLTLPHRERGMFFYFHGTKTFLQVEEVKFKLILVFLLKKHKFIIFVIYFAYYWQLNYIPW